MENSIEGTSTQKSIKESLNLLTVIYAQIYFPGFSNGLKDTAGFLGFNWTDTDCAGLLSIAWRHFWEDQHDKSIKEKLFRYNAQDCEALELLTETIQQIGDLTQDRSDKSEWRVKHRSMRILTGFLKNRNGKNLKVQFQAWNTSILQHTGTTRGTVFMRDLSTSKGEVKETEGSRQIFNSCGKDYQLGAFTYLPCMQSHILRQRSRANKNFS